MSSIFGGLAMLFIALAIALRNLYTTDADNSGLWITSGLLFVIGAFFVGAGVG